MTCCRKFCSVLLIFLFSILFIGCGADEEVPTEPGEEVVSEKWVDPEDIGKDYTIKIEDIKFDVLYTLDTGKTVTFKENRRGDVVTMREDGSLGALVTIPETDAQGNPIVIDGLPRFKQVHIGNIVPEGDPIVGIFETVTVRVPEHEIVELPFKFVKRLIRKEDNVKDTIPTLFSIQIDRVLDYHLPIYVEYQEQDRIELGGEVRRIRYLTVVFAGSHYARKIYGKGLFGSLHVGHGLNERSPEDVARASISILPYTEMKNIDLPVELDISHLADFGEFVDGEHPRLPLEDTVIPEGHKFRPYRIHSFSFLMAEIEIERNW